MRRGFFVGSMRRGLVMVGAVAALLSMVPTVASAFCGFYVAGADAELYANATMVVMMRDGTRTVLNMQNDYEGPPQDFALVIPVPVVLQEENVRTLDRAVFDRVDTLAAPRLVEYWEQDPCLVRDLERSREMVLPSSVPTPSPGSGGRGSLGVTIEAQFTVGEYEIVVLSAEDSTGLDTWLRQENYNIPEGAEPVLRPYVAAGTKFFVAKVDVEKVTFENGRAQLSPLRFHYDTPDFSLPVRLGLLNSNGPQDLLVHVLAADQRYEVANYPNVTIPSNIVVADRVRESFGEFYAALFDRTMEQNPRAVVTEYAWQASNCDPCPGPVLTETDLMTLGADVLPSISEGGEPGQDPWQAQQRLASFVLTRLHARYTADTLGEDLVFRPAAKIMGGRGMPDQNGDLPQGVETDSYANNFQGRYAILHPWEGPVACDEPVRGTWGGPPSGSGQDGQVRPARDLAYAPRGAVELSEVVRQNIPAIQVTASTVGLPVAAGAGAGATGVPATSTTGGNAGSTSGGGCASCSVGLGGRASRDPASLGVLGPWGLLSLLGVAVVARRRR